MKKVFWAGDSLEALRSFPAEVRREAGYELTRVQSGLDPTNWKPMNAVGPGVREIRITHRGQYRVFYVASRADGVYVLHAFQKKTQRTARREIDLARTRLRNVPKEKP